MKFLPSLLALTAVLTLACGDDDDTQAESSSTGASSSGGTGTSTGTSGTSGDDPSCGLGQIQCGNACVNPMSDEQYCGASADCIGTNAGTICAAGESCEVGSCEPGPANGCTIAGVEYPEGSRNPNNTCEACITASSTTSWTVDNVAQCDDGLYCTVGDTCVAGTCTGSARDCSDSVACNGVEACSELNEGSCLPGTPTCEAGSLCDVSADTCVSMCSGCSIDGVCYAEGAANPTNSCEICAVATNATAWSPNDGVACDDGAFCTTASTCSAGVCGGGTARDCSDGLACNGTETCDETMNACVAGTTTCTAGEICDNNTGMCVDGCALGCSIDGVCYGNDQVNPNNECEKCSTATSKTAWSPDDGISCDDGLFCTTGSTCNAGVCEGGSQMSCSDGVLCNGLETCNETTDTCDPGANACSSSQVCDHGTGSCVDICENGCTIDGQCYGSGLENPANACEVCQPDSSSSAWTAKTGECCTADDQCDASATEPICDLASNTCEGCIADVQCEDMPGATVCNDETGACVECVENSDCGEGRFCSASACFDQPHYVMFVTDVQPIDTVPRFTSLTGADDICNAAALEAGLDGNYSALLGSVDPVRTIADIVDDPNIEIRRADTEMTVIANNLAAMLDGNLDAPVLTDASGNDIDTDFEVYTGLQSDGTVASDSHCNNWSETDIITTYTFGLANQNNSTWVQDDTGMTPCADSARLYCIGR